MSDPQPQEALPKTARMTVGQIILLIVGVVLLFPGGCSLFFFVALLLENKPNTFSDPYVGVFYGFWIVSFVISAVGIALIYVAHKMRRNQPEQGTP